METRLVDPHNHVPEVTPGDEWGDSETLSSHFPGATTILPPKRPAAEGPAKSGGGKVEEGIRIESRNRLSTPDESPVTKLEVTEITGSVLRLQPEESASPKVPRSFTFMVRPASVKNKGGEGKDWGESPKQSLRWLVGAGTGIAALIVAAMMFLPTLNKSNAARVEPAGSSGVDAESTSELDLLLPLQSDAERVFANYAQAQLADDLLPQLRDAGSVKPLLRASRHSRLAPSDWVPDEHTTWQVFDGKNITYGILEGKLPDFSPFRAYMVRSGNRLLLDWKATTAYSTATIGELRNLQGDPSEIRAYVIPARFYTHVFPEQEYLSYQLLSANREDSMWVYARRDSPAGAGIAKLFRAGEIVQSESEEEPVTLRLARPPEGAQPNQWLIADLLHVDWILP